MAGSVFGKIAERVYANNLRLRIEDAIDSTSQVIPEVKPGLMRDTREVLSELRIPNQVEKGKGEGETWSRTQSGNETAWIIPSEDPKPSVVPSVVGMGARDAVFLLESAGMKVQLTGVGRVKRQSIPPGNSAAKGRTILLTLEQ